MGLGLFILSRALRVKNKPLPKKRSSKSFLKPILLSFLMAIPVEWKGNLAYLSRSERKLIAPQFGSTYWNILLFCLFLGPTGIHRAKVGKHGTAWLMLFLPVLNFFWWLVDLFQIITFRFKDFWGRTIDLNYLKGVRITPADLEQF